MQLGNTANIMRHNLGIDALTQHSPNRMTRPKCKAKTKSETEASSQSNNSLLLLLLLD